jgi:hypothetical protein
MTIVSCERCKKEFYAKPSWIKKGQGKYCSRKCGHESKKNGKIVKCYICKKEVYKKRKNIEGSKSGKLFCSKRCSLNWKNTTLIGEKHNNWKHGGNSSSYRNIIKRSSREIVCQICGNGDFRVLDVHHKDRNRRNNKLNNLIWLCCNCHFLVHHYVKEGKKLS